jgi:hypothetical protein
MNPRGILKLMEQYFDFARTNESERGCGFFKISPHVAKEYFTGVAYGKLPDASSYDMAERLPHLDTWGANDTRHDKILARETKWISAYRAANTASAGTVGHVYVCANPSFPMLVKIGYSRDLKKRMNTLSANVPRRYRLVNCIRTLEPEKLEASMHKKYAMLRNRTAEGVPTEFFNLSDWQVEAHFKTFKHGALYDGQP